MLNLNAKKLRRITIVLAMVAAAMMTILSVAVFADTGDTAAAGEAAAAAAATTTGLKAIAAGIAIGLAACGGAIGMGIFGANLLPAEARSAWVFSVLRLPKVFQDSLRLMVRSVQASCSDSYLSRQ